MAELTCKPQMSPGTEVGTNIIKDENPDGQNKEEPSTEGLGEGDEVVLPKKDKPDSTNGTLPPNRKKFVRNRFEEHLFELVEELKLRRAADVDYETKIKQLMKEKVQLENHLGDAKTKIQQLDTEFQDKMMYREKQHALQENELQFEKDKLRSAEETFQKESKILKEDIRSLQHSHYAHEKKIKEQELLLTSQSKSKAHNLSLISRLEERIEDMKHDIIHIRDHLEKADGMVREVVKINEDLSKVTNIQDKQISQYEVAVSDLKQRSKDSNQSRRSERNKHMETLAAREIELSKLQNDLICKSDALTTLQNDVVSTQNEKETLQNLLNEAHQLLSAHVDTNNKLEDGMKTMADRVDDLTNKLNAIQTGYDEKASELQVEKKTFSDAVESWKGQEMLFNEKIEDLENKTQTSANRIKDLEDINLEWNKKNSELKDEIFKLKRDLNKPMQTQESQTGVYTSNESVQAMPDLVHQESQATAATSNCFCQAVVDMNTSSTQWAIPVNNHSAQTEPPPTKDAAIHTQVEFLPVPPDTRHSESQTSVSFATCMKKIAGLGATSDAAVESEKSVTPGRRTSAVISVESEQAVLGGSCGNSETDAAIPDRRLESGKRAYEDNDPHQLDEKMGDKGPDTTSYPDSSSEGTSPASNKRFVPQLTNPSKYRFLDSKDLQSPVNQALSIPAVSPPTVPGPKHSSPTQPRKSAKRVKFSAKLELTPPTTQETEDRRIRAWSKVGAGAKPRLQATTRVVESVSENEDSSLFSEDDDDIGLGSQVEKIGIMLDENDKQRNRLQLKKKKV